MLSNGKHCWFVDQNDGTADFLKDLKGSAISVGLLRDAKPIMGAVYAPLLNSQSPD